MHGGGPRAGITTMQAALAALAAASRILHVTHVTAANGSIPLSYSIDRYPKLPFSTVANLATQSLLSCACTGLLAHSARSACKLRMWRLAAVAQGTLWLSRSVPCRVLHPAACPSAIGAWRGSLCRTWTMGKPHLCIRSIHFRSAQSRSGAALRSQSKVLARRGRRACRAGQAYAASWLQ